MPNFPIPRALRDHIRERALTHSARARDLALTGFPLTVTQIQDAVLDRETQGILRDLVETKGVKTISMFRELRLAFLRDKIPGLRRSIVVKLELPRAIFVQRSTAYGISTTGFNIDENHYLVPDLDAPGIDAESREKLMTWLGRALREERIREITVHIVGRVIHTEAIAPTMGHLQALWPMLCTLVDPSACQWISERDKYTKWRDKMRNPPARMARYTPSKLLKDHYAPLMKAAELQITTGMMLKDVIHKRGDIQAEIELWERIKNDITFPEALNY